MTVQHSAITEAQGIHEPKGVSTASAGQVYIANGAGSGTWRHIAHGAFYYTNIGTGTTYTAPTAYTLVNPTTTVDTSPHGFTHNSAGKLTYTNAEPLDIHLQTNLCIKHSSASDVDCYFKIYKNGVGITGGETVARGNSGVYTTLAFSYHFQIVQNDYVELYCKTASGNIIVHAYRLQIIGLP